MTTTVGRLQTVLDLDDGQFVAKMMRNGEVVENFGRRVDRSLTSLDRIERATTGILPRIRDFAIAAAAVRGALTTVRQVTIDWSVSIAAASGKLEKMQVLMEGFSQSTDESTRKMEANSSTDFLIDMAKRVPFALEELSSSFAKFKSVGIDPTTGSMDALTNAIARFGGSNSELHRASVAIQQMAGKGVLSMEELRQQLGEAVPTALATMARALNMTIAELVAKVSKGQVESTTALRKFFVQLAMENEGANARVMNTWEGLMSRLSTEWMLFLKQIGDTGFYERAKNALKGLIDTLGGPTAAKFAKNFGDGLIKIMNTASWVAQQFVKYWDQIANVAKIALAIGAARALQTALVGTVRIAAVLADVFTLLTNRSGLVFLLGAISSSAASATTGLTGLRAAAAFLTGPIGMLISAAAALGSVFFLTGESAEELAEKVREAGGEIAANAEDYEKLAEGAAEAYEEVQRLVERIGEVETRMKRASGWDKFYDNEILKTLNAQLSAAQENFVKMAEAQAAALAAIRKREQDTFVRGRMVEVDAALEANQRIFLADQKALDERMKNLTKEEAERQKQEILKRKALEDEAVLLKEIEKVEGQLAAARASKQNDANLGALWTKLSEKLHETREKANEAEEALINLDVVLLTGGSDKAAQKLAPLNGLFNQLTEDVEQLQAKLKTPGSAGIVEEITAKLEVMAEKAIAAGAAADKVNELVEKIRLLAIAKANLDANVKAQGFIETLQRELAGVNAVIDGTSAKISKFRERYLAGDAGELARIAAQRKITIEQLLTELETRSKIADEIERTRTLEEQMVNKTLQLQDDALVGKAKIIAAHNVEIAKYAELSRVAGLSIEERKKREIEFARFKAAMDAKLAQDLKTPMQKTAEEWDNLLDGIQNKIVDWANRSTEAFVEFARTGKFEFRDLINSILADMLRLMVQQQIMGPLFNLISSGVSSLSGVPAAPSTLTTPNTGMATSGPTGYADGGVMGPWGDIPMKMFAAGGVADRPMMSIFGEGDLPEAYVPLPDGRSIPVTMEGGGATQMSVQVNVINESGTPVQGEEVARRFDGEKLILDVVLSAMTRPGSFRDTVRGAVR